MALRYTTTEEAVENNMSALRAPDENTIIVEPYGNSSLLGRLRRGGAVFGNIGVTDDGNLRVNIMKWKDVNDLRGKRRV